MKSFKEYLRIITESNQKNYVIEFDGILKIKPLKSDLEETLNKTQKIIDEINENRKDDDKLKLIQEKDLHVTVLHQNYAKNLKKDFKNIEINDLNKINFEEELYYIKDGDKESIFVVVDDIDQKKIKKAINDNYENFEPNRIFHVSVANKICARSGSVGHSETKHLKPETSIELTPENIEKIGNKI